MQPRRKRDFPWWLVILVVAGLYLFWEMLTDDVYSAVLSTLSKGIGVTVLVTIIAFSAACLLGLGLAMAQLSQSRVLRQVSRLYIEIMRGIPIMVLLLYVAFVLTPLLVSGYNWLTEPFGGGGLRTRDISLLSRAVIALSLAYAAFLAEVFRAGILAVDAGQLEAAQALGLSRWQTFRLVVFPQAIRNILPPLGNDFVAMVKDSSLVSVLGVADITQLGKVISASNFRYFETYNVVAFFYLTMTITLSLALRALERRLRAKGEKKGG